LPKATPLLPLAQSFLEHDPLAAAQCIETMNEADALTVLKALPPSLVSKMFPHLQVSIASGLLSQFPSSLFNEVILKLEPNRAAAIILGMEQEAQKRLIDELPDKSREEIRELLIYPQNSAGRLMSTDFLALRQDVEVRDAVQRIRTLARKRNPASYAYVIDESNHLVGVINMRQLILESPDAELSSFMHRNVFSVNAFMDIEEVADEVTKRKFFAVPVVDSQNKLLGLIKADQLIGQVQQEATEDLLRMFGAGGTERTFSPMSFSLRKRLPWLHVNLATAFLAAAVVALFESTIAQVTALAVFLPVCVRSPVKDSGRWFQKNH
jgi:magnesium transporter